MAVKTMRVVFSEARTVYDHLGKVEQSFAAGQEYDLPETSADRWIRRGVAKVAPPPKPAPAKSSKAKTTKKDAE